MVRDILEFPEVLPKKKKNLLTYHIWECRQKWLFMPLKLHTFHLDIMFQDILTRQRKANEFSRMLTSWSTSFHAFCPHLQRKNTYVKFHRNMVPLKFLRETHIFANMIFVSMYCICLFICYKSWKWDINADSQRLEKGSYLNLIFTQNVTNMSFQVPWDMNQPTLCPFISLVRILGLPWWHTG